MVNEIVGLSCVHVGTGTGGTISMLGGVSFLSSHHLLLSSHSPSLTLARVAIVDRRGQAIYDTFVQPTSPVENYRTATTGLDASYFEGGKQRLLFSL